jgi:hypothetical protein
MKISLLTGRRGLAACATLAAIAASAMPGIAQASQVPRAAPHNRPSAQHRHLTRVQKAKLRGTILRAGADARDRSYSFPCDPYQYDSRGFYWHKCFTQPSVGIGYYQYDWWNGSEWVFWFTDWQSVLGY